MHRTIKDTQDTYLENKIDKYFCPDCAKSLISKELEAMKV